MDVSAKHAGVWNPIVMQETVYSEGTKKKKKENQYQRLPPGKKGRDRQNILAEIGRKVKNCKRKGALGVEPRTS